MKKTAIAHANIALVKYWGKRDIALNLPAVGSISMTLKALFTETSVEFREDLEQDLLILNGDKASETQARRAGQFLELFREEAGHQRKAKIVTRNNFPTGAGLASSASGFAALTLAASKAAQLTHSPARLSELARLGSGSAARSIFGGFVEMDHGKNSNGSDSVARPMHPADYWPLEMLILITSEAEKEIGSTAGMNLTAETSPYYKAWIDTAEADLKRMRQAIDDRNFTRLGEIAEYSCLKMHGLAMSADPGILYWNGLSMTLIQAVRKLRKNGIEAYFTIDAGPQIKVICPPGGAAKVRSHLENIDGIRSILTTGIGPAAYIVDDE